MLGSYGSHVRQVPECGTYREGSQVGHVATASGEKCG